MSAIGELRMSTWVVYLEPMGKPRMTRYGAHTQRVKKYWKWKQQLLLLMGGYPSDPHIVSWEAHVPMPKSWSKRKKDFMAGQMHRQKPDRDNIDKAILDALFKDDSRIAAGTISKYWAASPELARIEITMTWREE